MPSLETARRLNALMTNGQALKEMSDSVMQETFYNDIQTRTCYLYDYYHDNEPDIRTGYIPNTDSGKIKVDLKFIVKEYKSLAKDEPEYHIQFTPNDWNERFYPTNFGTVEELDFFNIYRKDDIHFPIGLYCDVPDDRGVYWKWLVTYEDAANQFPKFGLLRCNYLFKWIMDDGVTRHKRQMWGVQRTQSSLKRYLPQWCVITGNRYNELLSNCWKAFRALLLQRKYEIKLGVNV